MCSDRGEDMANLDFCRSTCTVTCLILKDLLASADIVRTTSAPLVILSAEKRQQTDNAIKW